MAKNDVVLLDGILDDRLRDIPSPDRGEAFELLVFEQVLKDLDLSADEIEHGWVDGKDDGGIDGFFITINGHLLVDPDALQWPRRNAEIDVWVFTCKHKDSFQQAPLNALAATLPELLDFSKTELREAYSDELLAVRACLHLAYKTLSAHRPKLAFHFVYASRGDAADVPSNISARADQVVEIPRGLFSSCTSEFRFVGAAELVQLYRKAKTFSLDLPFLESMPHRQGSYVVLVRLADYVQCVTEEGGELRRYLFDSNVRDYLGDTTVNDDILASLSDATSPDFWWLNNGVTILATGATAIGKVMQLTDVQIVNGLQTTESIYRHFQSAGAESTERALLVKIIVSTDAQARDRIIRATNNQNVVETASLRATDKVQRDIEAILERCGWFYERRKNYFRNVGKPAARFVTPLYLASAFVALVAKHPTKAARLRTRFMREDSSYRMIFNESEPIELWPVLVDIMKWTEEGLGRLHPKFGRSERFTAKWRALVAFLCVARLLKKFSYSRTELLALDIRSAPAGTMDEVWSTIEGMTEPRASRDAASGTFVGKCCMSLAYRFGTADPQALRNGEHSPEMPRRPFPMPSEQLIDDVDRVLPQQPWKPLTHVEVAARLGVPSRFVSAAIQELIRRGRRHRQKDGVVYGADGSVVAVDEDRPEARLLRPAKEPS